MWNRENFISLICLILLTICCVSDILAQRTINTKEESSIEIKVRFHGGDSTSIYTEFIKLNYLSVLPVGYGTCTFEKTYTPSPSSKVVKLISKFISRRGLVETDSRSNSLIITDTKEKVDLIQKMLREWDKPDTDLDEIIKNFESKSK